MGRLALIEEFHGDKTQTQVAKDYGVAKKTVKRVWVEEFGEEAVYQRRLRSHSRASARFNPWRGTVTKGAFPPGEAHPEFGKRGPEAKRYNPDAALRLRDGYVLTRVPDWWEGEAYRESYALEHRVVYAEHNGLTSIPDGMVVHHINLVRDDNRPENLALMTSSEHIAYHNSLRALG